jgi:hypothetical protein
MTRRDNIAAWTLFFMVLTSVLVGMSTDSLAIGFAVASGFMAIAGIMELNQ